MGPGITSKVFNKWASEQVINYGESESQWESEWATSGRRRKVRLQVSKPIRSDPQGYLGHWPAQGHLILHCLAMSSQPLTCESLVISISSRHCWYLDKVRGSDNAVFQYDIQIGEMVPWKWWVLSPQKFENVWHTMQAHKLKGGGPCHAFVSEETPPDK